MARSFLLRPFVVLAVLLFAGCASFPSPGADGDTLFVLLSENPAPRAGLEGAADALRFQGPSPFSIAVGGDERRVYAVRVKPGRYTLAGSDLTAAEPSAASAFDIPGGAVYLFPMKYTRVRDGLFRLRRLVPLVPEDQKNASALLIDYLDYEKWFGRTAEGFGAFTPRLGTNEGNVEFSIISTPPGAQVTIDDQEWGTTPVTATLQTGKHLLQLEIPGVALSKTFVDVQSKGEVNVTLPILPAQEAKDLKEKSRRITILLSAFQNMGSPESDNLRTVFPQVIGADLKGDSRIDLVDEGGLVARGGGVPGKPDFAVANQKGIDLIVSGYYMARPDSLLVYAALYDVQSELPRASIMYTGEAGLAMFDSIDAMAAEFIAGIARALPEVRARAVKGATVESRLVSYEKKRTETAIIETRQANKSSLSFTVNPSIAAVRNIRPPAMPYTLLAYLPLGVIYTWSPGGPLALMMILQPAVAFDKGDYSSSPYLDIPLRIGPEYTLFGYNVDLSFAFLGQARFMQAYFDTGTGGKEYKAIWFWGIGLETSARLYLQSRVSERPSYFLFGFEWYIIGMQTGFDLSSPNLIPVELSLSVGYGLRL